MSSHLFDTNALFEYYRGSVAGVEVEALLQDDGYAYVTNLASLELRSVLATRRREAKLPSDDHDVIVRQLDYDTSSVGRMRVHMIRSNFLAPCAKLIAEFRRHAQSGAQMG